MPITKISSSVKRRGFFIGYLLFPFLYSRVNTQSAPDGRALKEKDAPSVPDIDIYVLYIIGSQSNLPNFLTLYERPPSELEKSNPVILLFCQAINCQSH
jgi:hypothetical protein